MLVSRQPIVASVRRDAWVEVDLGAIEYNMKVVRSWLTPTTQLMGIVKSDAYGHGAPGVAEVLVASGADWLGVASLDEGCQLRQAGIKTPILLLSPCPAWALGTAIENDLQLAITDATQVADAASTSAKLQRPAKVHIKVDTGMHRLGVRPEQVPDLLSVIANHPQVSLCGIFSHLCKADDAEMTGKQNACFQNVLNNVEAQNIGIAHLASSDATKLFPDTHHDMVRPGLILYGLEPNTVSTIAKPAISVRGRINHLQHISTGESVGYNLTWTAQRATRIASIPIGYADGIDRRLSNDMEGILLKSRVKQIGLISMDQMMFDVTDVPQAELGDVITLIGCEPEHSQSGPGRHEHTLYLADWANRLGTITYELSCRLRARMPRIYTRHNVNAPLKDG